MSGIKLFCLPYAGGSSAIYSKWSKLLDGAIKLYPFELAGRAGRYREPYYNTIKEAVADIVKMLEEECRGSEYAVWGHSLGSILAYETICMLQEKNLRLPVHVFFSGRYPPSIRKENRNLHTLPEPEFEKEALKLGGIPDNLIRMRGLLKSAMQTLRADYKLLETYEPNSLKRKFDFNISVFAGKDDDLAQPADMNKWKNYCGSQCNFYYFEGGHFYLHKHAWEITRIINDTLVNIVEEEAYGG